jgi:hypothetical protein
MISTTNDYKANALASITAICNFMDKHGRTPSTTNLDPKIKKLAYKLGNLRQAKAGHIPGAKFHKNYEMLVAARGYAGLFKSDFVMPIKKSSKKK